MTDAFLSIGQGDGWSGDIRLTEESTDWSTVPGDRKHAPFQRNFGDYITLAAEGNAFVAAWTDGRTGRPRILTRTITVSP